MTASNSLSKKESDFRPPSHEKQALIQSDGASRGNNKYGPKLGAWGFVDFGENTSDDAPHKESYGYLGPGVDSMVAEWHGAIAALKHADRSNYTKICLQVDCESIVLQLNRKSAGRSTRDSPILWPLFCQALRYVQTMKARRAEVLIEFISREHNTVADGLCNRAIDEHLARARRHASADVRRLRR